jgi:CBS domain containing-hemolysin-like protein
MPPRILMPEFAMSQSPPRNEPADSEHRALPMVMPQPGEQPEGWLTRVMRILFGWKAASTRADLELVLTTEQQQSGFSPEEAAMLKNILGLRETRIEGIMVTRADIVAVQQDITLGDLVKVYEVAGHSRLVVYNDTLDDPTGMVHIRDLVAHMAARASADATPVSTDHVSADHVSADHAAGDHGATEHGTTNHSEHSQAAALNFANIDLSTPLSAAHLVREMLYAPPSMPALDLLAKMQATRIHLALVIDEYGGSDGLVSIEDLVELIVGDIADEHDETEGPTVTRQNDGSFLANGRASLDDVRAAIGEEFDVGEVAEEVDTLGGYLVTKAGHVPVRGELVPGPDPFEAEVLDADPRRVKRARIYLRKDRRPAGLREPSARTPATRPVAARDDADRPTPTNPNTPRAP